VAGGWWLMGDWHLTLACLIPNTVVPEESVCKHRGYAVLHEDGRAGVRVWLGDMDEAGY
jgi:hypothetical protein